MLFRAFLGISLTENCKVEFCLPFICKHKETLVKTIRCNLTKTGRIFATFTESLYKSMGKRPLNFQKNSPVYRRIMRSSISLVYVRSIGFVSILT